MVVGCGGGEWWVFGESMVRGVERGAWYVVD